MRHWFDVWIDDKPHKQTSIRRKEGALTHFALYFLPKFAQIFCRREKTQKHLSQWWYWQEQAHHQQMKEEPSTSMASGRERGVPSMEKMAKPEGVSNSTMIRPWSPKLATCKHRRHTQARKIALEKNVHRLIVGSEAVALISAKPEPATSVTGGAGCSPTPPPHPTTHKNIDLGSCGVESWFHECAKSPRQISLPPPYTCWRTR